MFLEPITYSKLEEAMRVAYGGDHAIFDFYDPSVSVSTVDDICSDIVKKIKEYDPVKLIGVYEDGQIIGYVVCREDLLISFAISKRYRTAEKLKEFFANIKRIMPALFVCHLWSKNERAIKWLEKSGMVKESDNLLITKLICQ